MCDVKPRLGASLEGNPKTEELMKSDAEIRHDVIDELRWDPQIPEPDAIGVGRHRRGGGTDRSHRHLRTEAGRGPGGRARRGRQGSRQRDKGRAGRDGRDDADIATAIARILDWDVQIPEGPVHARVEAGWVILAGEVGYDFQRREVERMVRQVRGVTGGRGRRNHGRGP